VSDDTIDSLRQQLRVAERIKQAAIDCTKSWDNILDELVWQRPNIDAHEIPADYLQTMIARYPHYADDLIDFAKRWNSDKPLSDEELDDMEIDEESMKRSAASCLMMLKWSMRIRKAETARNELAEALRPLANAWAHTSLRYERIGSDWHQRMPGHWPWNPRLTVEDARRAHALLARLDAENGLTDVR